MARLVAIKATDRVQNFRPIIELTRHGNLLCYESCSGRWFRSDRWHVEDAIAQLQGLYENCICVNLNDLYSLLNINTTNRGRIYGWNQAIHGERTMLLKVDLMEQGFMTMDEPVLVIAPNVYPERDYKDHI